MLPPPGIIAPSGPGIDGISEFIAPPYGSSGFIRTVCCSRFHRLRTASSERPGSRAAFCRHRSPSSFTPRWIAMSSSGVHGVRFVGSRPGSGSARAILCGLCSPPPAAMCRRLPGSGGYAAAIARE